MSEKERWVVALAKGHLAQLKGVLYMKKVLLLLAVSAVLVMLFASAALAQKYNYSGGMSASPMATSSATASPSATATASATAPETSPATKEQLRLQAPEI